MCRTLRHLTFSLAATAAHFGISASAFATAPETKERIEVAFVLDTTGSMEGLIDGAKRKIWSIANAIVDVNPDADIRMALIGYRDVGDDYVIRSHDMTPDIQGLYSDLIQFATDGGGDEPEAVNEALDAAVRKLRWSEGQDARRIVFLVGDAPPHMDYANGPKYSDITKDAREKGIIINAIQAGDSAETQEYWQKIAKLGKGRYIAIPQDGGQIQVVNSPYDRQIIDLQNRINQTVIPYGSLEIQEQVNAKMAARAESAAPVMVDNSRFYSKKTASKEIVTGGGDLLDDVRNHVRKLDDVKEDELPKDFQGKSKGELKSLVDARTAEREELEADMAVLIRKRDEYVAKVAKEAPGMEGSGKGDSFDKKVTEILKQQL